MPMELCDTKEVILESMRGLHLSFNPLVRRNLISFFSLAIAEHVWQSLSLLPHLCCPVPQPIAQRVSPLHTDEELSDTMPLRVFL